MFQRIVVPLDGSDIAEQALGPAAELAQRLGVPLHLIRVVDLPNTDVSSMFGYMADSRAMADQVMSEMRLAHEYLHENVRALVDLGHQVTDQVEVGQPATAIVDLTRAGDCLVMASHGRSGIARWYIGSVAEQVMRQARVPVMIVRGPFQQSPDQASHRNALAS